MTDEPGRTNRPNRVLVGQVAVVALGLTACWVVATVLVAVIAPATWGGLALAATAVLAVATGVLAATLIVRFTTAGIKPLLGRLLPWSDIAWVGLKRGPLGYTSVWIATPIGRSLADRELDQLGGFGIRRQVSALATEIAERAGVAPPSTDTPPATGAGRRVA